MAKKKQPRKHTLVRDMNQDRIPPEQWVRLPSGGRRHKQYLRWKLQDEVDAFKESGFSDMDKMADILEVLRCIAWFNNWDWNDVEQARTDLMVKNGKYLEGILLKVNTTPTEEDPDGGGRTDASNQADSDGEVLD